MSKEEFLKIQTCVLKVNIHCDGCKQKVKKILHKIEGVYTTSIDSEQGKVTVSGNVDRTTLIKKLNKAGKHAELWGTQKPPNSNEVSQPKNLQNGNGKGTPNNNNSSSNQNNKPTKAGGNNNNNHQKGAQQIPNRNLNQLQNNQQQQMQQQQQLQQHLQQLQQMKAFKDLKLPELKDTRMHVPNSKSVSLNLPPPDEGFTDDEFENYDDDFEEEEEDDDDEQEFDNEVDDLPPLNKMKLGNGNVPVPQAANMIPNGIMNGQHPQSMNAQPKAVGNGGGSVNNSKKGGGGNLVVDGGPSGGGGKKGDGGGSVNNNGGNPNHGNRGSKNGGGHVEGDAKNGNQGGKGGGNNNRTGGAQVGQMGPMSMPQMANMQMGHMAGVPAVHGLPAAASTNGVGVGPVYFRGAPPEMAAGNPYQQQLVAQMMINQQRANGNEQFQPMMYSRPPPAVNYMPPYPYPYPPPLGPDPYTHYFSDENTSSCSVM